MKNCSQINRTSNNESESITTRRITGAVAPLSVQPARAWDKMLANLDRASAQLRGSRSTAVSRSM